MAKKSGRTPIGKSSSTRPSEPLIRENDTVICMERVTMPDHTPGTSHYQSLITESVMVDGGPGVTIEVATFDGGRVAYNLTKEEVTRLTNWLTRWSNTPFTPANPFMRNLRRGVERFAKPKRKGPSNG